MLSLHRKHRPQTVAQLDQERVRTVFETILKTGRFAQSYLFTGPKGTGKTSSARILAKILNCESNLEAIKVGQSLHEPCNLCDTCTSIMAGTSSCLVEIDGASNRKIDDVRDLREQVNLLPTQGLFSIYIIDEVHMLTTEAFNALLKTLEEPPRHVVFALCTTELHKLPATIISRCSVVEFGLSETAEIVRALERVVKAEKIKAETEALDLIAQASDGSFRDAMNLFQAASASGGNLDLDTVKAVLFQTDHQVINQLLDHVLAGEIHQALALVKQAEDSGNDISKLTKTLLTVAVERLKVGVIENQGVDQALTEVVEVLSQAYRRFVHVPIAALPLEMAIVEYGLKSGTLTAASASHTPKKEINIPISNKSVQTINLKPQRPTQAVSEPEPITQATPAPNKQEAPAQPLKKSTNSVEISLEDVTKNWPTILAKVGDHNHGIVSFLNRGSLVECRENCLVIGVGYKFHKEQLEQDRCLRIVEQVLEQVMGETITVRIELNQKPVKPELQAHDNLSAQIPETDKNLAKAVEDVFGV